MCRRASDKAFFLRHILWLLLSAGRPRDPSREMVRYAPRLVSSREEYPADLGITHGFRVVKGGANAPYAAVVYFFMEIALMALNPHFSCNSSISRFLFRE